MEEFLALGRQRNNDNKQNSEQTQEKSNTLESRSDSSEERSLFAEREAPPPPPPPSSEQENVQQTESRRFNSAKVAGNAEATLKKAEQIQRSAQSIGDLSTQEQAVVNEAKRLAIQARFEIEKEQRDEVRENRVEALNEARINAAEARRANAPNPFANGIKTPFDKLEEVSSSVTLGNSINLNA